MGKELKLIFKVLLLILLEVSCLFFCYVNLVSFTIAENHHLLLIIISINREHVGSSAQVKVVRSWMPAPKIAVVKHCHQSAHTMGIHIITPANLKMRNVNEMEI